MKLSIKYLGKIITDIKLEEGHTYFGGRQIDCDFVLENEMLSRKHIKVYQSSTTENWIIESISEKKGLSLNGEYIDSFELEDSSVLSLNNYIFEFSKEPEEQEKPEEVSEQLPALEKSQTDVKEPLDGATKVFLTNSHIHSLHISIEGERSDYVTLSEGTSWTLGRSEDCEIHINYNILSREHLQFLKEHNTFKVINLGSSNGATLNGKEMTDNKHYILNINDRIVIGYLNIVFEVRNKKLEDMMKNLPTIASEENSPASTMAFQKVILEESFEENEKSPSKNLFNKKRIIMFGGVGILLIFLFFFNSGKENKEEQEKNDKKIEESNLIKDSYNLAFKFLQQKKFQFCIDELNKLHSLTPYYLDSKQILTQCQNSSENQKQYEELLAYETKKKETEQRVKKMALECEKQADNFQTVNDLYACAKEVLELDPANAIINSIKLKIEEKSTLLQIKEEKKQDYRKKIHSKKYLYNKALKIHKQNKPLKAISAYKAFLRVAKGVSGLSSLYKKSEQAINKLQVTYDNTLNSLYSNCEKFIKAGEMRKAFYKCEAILGFKPNDKKALQHMKLAKSTIRNSLKDLYAKSVFEESLSNVEEAKKMWQKILKEDLKEGYYYKKAKILTDKYK